MTTTRAFVVLLLASVACDRVLSLEPRPLASDAAQPCQAGAGFPRGEPVPISGAYSVEAARFNGTQSIAYLSLCPESGDKTRCDLYASPFTAATNTFTSFTKLAGVSDPTRYDAYPTITPTGEHLLFGSTRLDQLRVWVAAATNSSFDAPTFTRLALPANKQNSNEPSILGDGATVYFAAGLPWDLYRTSGAPPDFGAAPVEVPGVNSPADEFAPVVADDELEIFFASNRQEPGGAMALDVYTATRTSATEDFATPQRVGELSGSTTIDWPLWLSPDRCSLYYINKDTTTNVATLAVARRR